MTRQQQWALRAHEQVLDLAKTGDKAKHKTFAMKMPGLIQQSGLLQALVFVQTRGDEGRAFVESLAKVFGAERAVRLVEDVKKAELPAYLALTRDLLDVTVWMRRFAQIVMKDVKEDDHAVAGAV